MCYCGRAAYVATLHIVAEPRVLRAGRARARAASAWSDVGGASYLLYSPPKPLILRRGHTHTLLAWRRLKLGSGMGGGGALG